jgi:hypothetical protein
MITKYICERCADSDFYSTIELARKHIYEIHIPYMVDELISDIEESDPEDS